MSDISNAIDQQEATVDAIIYASPSLNIETRRDITEGWHRIRTAAGLNEPEPIPVAEAIEAITPEPDTKNKTKSKA